MAEADNEKKFSFIAASTFTRFRQVKIVRFAPWRHSSKEPRLDDDRRVFYIVKHFEKTSSTKTASNYSTNAKGILQAI
jgi:hypothetical protein